jgi:hypothetical protein
MTDIRPSTFLRRILLADAAISGATGVLMAAGAGLLEPLLGIPADLLRYAGASLLPFAALLAHFATRERLPAPAVPAIVTVNALWAAASIVLLLSGWIAPTGLGYAFVIAQAVVVAAFAELQYFAARKAVPIAA